MGTFSLRPLSLLSNSDLLPLQAFLERLHNTRMFGSMIEEESLQEEFDGLIVALEEMADGQPPADLDLQQQHVQAAVGEEERDEMLAAALV